MPRVLRPPVQVFVRAGAAGLLGGAVLGVLSVIADPEYIPLAAPAGALVGLLCALAAATAWLACLTRAPDRPWRGRSLAGLASAAVVFLLAGSIARSTVLSPFVAGAAAGAGLIAFLTAPVLGYVRQRPR